MTRGRGRAGEETSSVVVVVVFVVFVLSIKNKLLLGYLSG